VALPGESQPEMAAFRLGHAENTADFFLHVPALEPEDERARTNEVFAHPLLGDLRKAFTSPNVATAPHSPSRERGSHRFSVLRDSPNYASVILAAIHRCTVEVAAGVQDHSADRLRTI
jgi:hypothetical protein